MSQAIRDRAWLTAHVRMRSEARLRRLAQLLNFLIFWFSTVLTCLTVYQLIADKNPTRDIISAALAILVLALSIFIPTLNLDKEAEKFRECYLKLQRLMDTVQDDEEFKSTYYNILDAYPNHPSRDYTDFVVFSSKINQPIENGNGPISPSAAMCISYYFWKVAGFMVAATAVLSPGMLYFLL